MLMSDVNFSLSLRASEYFFLKEELVQLMP